MSPILIVSIVNKQSARPKIVRSMNIKYRLDVVRCSIFEPDWCRNSTSIQYFWTGDQALQADSQQILRKILRIIILLYIIPKQFTVKAHPALFEGEAGGGEEDKI